MVRNNFEHMNFKESNLNYGKESEIKFAPSKKIWETFFFPSLSLSLYSLLLTTAFSCKNFFLPKFPTYLAGYPHRYQSFSFMLRLLSSTFNYLHITRLYLVFLLILHHTLTFLLLLYAILFLDSSFIKFDSSFLLLLSSLKKTFSSLIFCILCPVLLLLVSPLWISIYQPVIWLSSINVSLFYHFKLISFRSLSLHAFNYT